jgi:DNA-directed RNA polymerase specialized sigma24 family protein
MSSAVPAAASASTTRSPTRSWSPGGVSMRSRSRRGRGCWASPGECSPISGVGCAGDRLALASSARIAWEPPAGVSAELAGALRELTGREREALMLVAWDGLTPAEAAVAAGCSATAFRVRLHRARRRVAARLGIEPATTNVTEKLT